jgi:hypothetical protein
VTAAENLLTRLDTGKWPNLDDETLNAEATPLTALFAAAGAPPTPPAFTDFHSPEYLREFDALDHCGFDFDDHACHGKFHFFHDRN